MGAPAAWCGPSGRRAVGSCELLELLLICLEQTNEVRGRIYGPACSICGVSVFLPGVISGCRLVPKGYCELWLVASSSVAKSCISECSLFSHYLYSEVTANMSSMQIHRSH
jgi:hypothetical protein